MAESRELQMSRVTLQGETRLTIQEHFTKLYRFLSKHADKWEEIGLYLGFLPPELSSKKGQLFNDTLRLSEMLSQWLQWAPGDGRGSKSYATLEQLQSALNNNRLGVSAAELKKAIGINVAASSLVPINAGEQTLDFPYLDLENLSSSESERIKLQLGSDTTEIITTFSTLINDTKQSLKGQGKTPHDVASCIVSIGAYKSYRIRNPILEQERETLKGAESIDEIFLILPYRMSFFNYELLEYIINRLGTDQDKENMKEYLRKFKEFCKRKVFEVPPCVYGESSQARDDKVFVVKLTEVDNPILEDVSIAKKKIASILGVHIAMLQLLAIEKGCVELHFMLPESICRKIFPLEVCQLKRLFSEGMIISYNINAILALLSNVTFDYRRSFELPPFFVQNFFDDFYKLTPSRLTSVQSICRPKARFLLSEIVQLPFQQEYDSEERNIATTLSEPGTYQSVKLKGFCSAEFEWEVISGAIKEYGITIKCCGPWRREFIYTRCYDYVTVSEYDYSNDKHLSPPNGIPALLTGLTDLQTLDPGDRAGIQVTADGKLQFFLNNKCEGKIDIWLKKYLSGSVYPFVRIRGGDVRVTRAVMTRYLVVPSLQEVCMEVIGKSVELEDAENLPLPHHVKKVLKSYIIHRIMDPAPRQYFDLF